MVTQQAEQKITYTTMSVDQAEAFDRAFDEALQTVLGQLGQEYPVYIANQPRTVGRTFEDRSPNDTRQLVGRFQEAGQTEADAAVAAARNAFPAWSGMLWRERLALLRRAANNFRARKYEMAAWLSIEAGKPRLEAMGEVEEAADLIDTYCGQMEEHDGFVIQLNQISPQEVNHSVLKPYGVWLVIAPFNFPIALATGMLAGATVAGNTVVFKPSHDTPVTGIKVYECFRDAELPAGTVNILTGHGNDIGEMLSTNPGVDGIVFTGSKEVGCHIYAEFSARRPRPCITEMGGKNPVIVTNNADLDKAVEGTVRAAFGYSGQKCSAASRLYVQEDVARDFLNRMIRRTERIVVGNATRADVFVGPVINERASAHFQEAAERCRRDGRILVGGRLLTDGDLQYGYFCQPTIAELPPDHPYFYEELFVPLIVVATFRTLDEAIERANDSEYGLTAGIFSENQNELQQFFDRVQAGVLYANRKGGATTGAWPGVQSFGGWKASGSPGKSALGPYYVQQFLREQNQTIVSD